MVNLFIQTTWPYFIKHQGKELHNLQGELYNTDA